MNALRKLVLNKNAILKTKTAKHLNLINYPIDNKCISRCRNNRSINSNSIDEMPQNQSRFGITKIILNIVLFTLIGSLATKFLVSVFEKEKLILNDDDGDSDDDD